MNINAIVEKHQKIFGSVEKETEKADSIFLSGKLSLERALQRYLGSFSHSPFKLIQNDNDLTIKLYKSDLSFSLIKTKVDNKYAPGIKYIIAVDDEEVVDEEFGFYDSDSNSWEVYNPLTEVYLKWDSNIDDILAQTIDDFVQRASDDFKLKYFPKMSKLKRDN